MATDAGADQSAIFQLQPYFYEIKGKGTCYSFFAGP